jgi:hypothetical protein
MVPEQQWELGNPSLATAVYPPTPRIKHTHLHIGLHVTRQRWQQRAGSRHESVRHSSLVHVVRQAQQQRVARQLQPAVWCRCSSHVAGELQLQACCGVGLQVPHSEVRLPACEGRHTCGMSIRQSSRGAEQQFPAKAQPALGANCSQ